MFTGSKKRKLYIYGDQNQSKKSILTNDIQAAKIKNAGHFMLLDKPKETYKTISHFLKKQERLY